LDNTCWQYIGSKRWWMLAVLHLTTVHTESKCSLGTAPNDDQRPANGRRVADNTYSWWQRVRLSTSSLSRWIISHRLSGRVDRLIAAIATRQRRTTADKTTVRAGVTPVRAGGESVAAMRLPLDNSDRHGSESDYIRSHTCSVGRSPLTRGDRCHRTSPIIPLLVQRWRCVAIATR